MKNMDYIDKIQRTLPSLNYIDSIQKMQESMNYSMTLEKAMDSFKLSHSTEHMIKSLGYMDTIQKSIESFKLSDSMERMIKSMDYANTIQKTISSLNINDSILKMVNSTKINATIQKSLEAFKFSDSMERMIKSMDYVNTIQRTMSSVKINDSILKMTETLNYEKTLTNLLNSHDIANNMRGVGSFLAKPNILEQIIDSNPSWDAWDADTDSIQKEYFVQSIAPLVESSNDKIFVSHFLKLPPAIQAYIIFFFLHFFMPQLNSICADILNPYVTEILTNSNKTDKEFIKEIKNVPASSLGVDTSGVRFITGTNVRLRPRPSTNSKILDELDIGQVVEVLRKKKNWIQVKVTYEDEQLTGWVFTRYTAKFKK